MVHGGWMTTSGAVWRRDDDPERPVRVPVPAWVIETASERILVDTGLNPAACADPAGFYGRQEAAIFTLEQEVPVHEQIDTGAITRIVLTHLHFDHVGGLSMLPPGIPVVVQRREWEAGRDEAAIERNFFYPRDYGETGHEIVLVEGDHDLLGDGSIELLLTPGHTPGHQSVRVGEDLVIGADVGHYASSLDDHRFPAFADDYAEQTRSAERLRALRDGGAQVTPGHDPDVLRPGPLERPS
jgi:glyoxylase-like metal-dependent hydrolase (beta-lactamase superfamily II)